MAKDKLVSFLVRQRSLQTSYPTWTGVLYRMVPAGGKSFTKPSSWRMLRDFALMAGWVRDAFQILGSLEPLLWYIESKLFQAKASLLWVLAVSQWVVGLTVCLKWEAHNTFRWWYFAFQVLHAQKTLSLHGALGVSDVRDIRFYLAWIECSDWSQVSLE